ncbi:CRAL-TRIO domain-containing protein [Powellomyces hirtus]|nr:CRAL-TRIO domain-containing protein [Powellomyces hirtus]
MTSNDPGHIDNLSTDQTKVLQEYWKVLLERLSTDESAQGSLTEELWLACALDRPDQLTLRFLRARKWDVQKAVEMTMNALKWRVDFGVKELLANGERDLDLQELESGKSYFQGTDKQGRPCCFVFARLHDKNEVDVEKTKKLTVLTLETGRMVLTPPQELACIVFDLTGFGLNNFQVEVVRFLSDCMQNFYPESLGQALVVNAPWVFNGCWAIIKPWLDPVVAAKIRFVKSTELPTLIDVAKLPESLGGTASDFAYLPPTADEEADFAKLRADTAANESAWKTYREAYKSYTESTRKWAGGDAESTAERIKAEAHLKEAYMKLSPFIRTRTTYHRRGVVNDPALSTPI